MRGRILARESSFSVERWHRDALFELHNDDALWAYMIRALEEFRETPAVRYNNPVLLRLLRMGIFDWSGQDKTLLQSLPGMFTDCV